MLAQKKRKKKEKEKTLGGFEFNKQTLLVRDNKLLTEEKKLIGP